MRQLSLGSVCRQLHKETSLLPIASARFLALAPADVLKFGHRMPLPQRRAVQQLKIRLVENQDMEDFWQCDTEAWYGLDWSGISPERVMRGMRTAFPGLRELTLEVHNVFLYGMPPDLDGYKPPKWMVEGKVMCGQPRILIEGYACDYACFGPANYAGHR